MTVHDGNGWTRCDRGHRHWGRHGAAGLLAAAPGPDGADLVLLQQRSWWGSHGGAWGPPGGARDSHESAAAAALREAAEECAVDTSQISVHGLAIDDHGGWTYQTVLGTAAEPLAAAPVSEETSEVAWVRAGDVERLRLHPGFAGQWQALRAALRPAVVIVDAANVMGSRPDGWWRDRAGAAERLCAEVARLAGRGTDSLPVPRPALDWWFPRFVVVLEGAAAAARPAAPGVTVVRAGGHGDDEIARQAAGAVQAGAGGAVQAGGARQAAGAVQAGGAVLVVTADRELRARCAAVGAAVTGPRWLLGLL